MQPEEHKIIFETNWPKMKYKYHKQYCETIFKGINLKNKTILDIGCGDGRFSLYMHHKGAKEIVGIEPESDGSANINLNKFRKIIKNNKINTITIKEDKIEEFETTKQYDIILMSNSINHLDEEACKILHKSKEAKEKYQKLLIKIKKLLAKKGELIIIDCSNKNFWNEIGRKSPFAKSIEWEKHQEPKIWIKEIEKIGLKKKKLDWTIQHQIPKIGFLLDNNLVAKLTNSHFRIVMKKR